MGPNRTSHGADTEGIIWVINDDQWSAREYKKSPPITWLFLARCGQAAAMQGTMWSMANSSSCLLMGIRSELRDEAHAIWTWNKDSSATLQVPIVEKALELTLNQIISSS